MRGHVDPESSLFGYFPIGERIPENRASDVP